jgi:hypothetical protein
VNVKIEDVSSAARRDLLLWFEDQCEVSFELKGDAWVDGYTRGYLEAILLQKHAWSRAQEILAREKNNGKHT